MSELELYEDRFLNSSKKRKAKNLTEYIEKLLEVERFIEASFFHSILFNLKPEHIKTVSLGYKIAIRSFNYNDVVKYDRIISELPKYRKEWLTFRVEYFFSIQNKNKLEITINDLLKEGVVENGFYQVIIESIMFNRSCSNIKSLLSNFEKNNLKWDENTEKKMKKIVVEKVVNNLVGLVNA